MASTVLNLTASESAHYESSTQKHRLLKEVIDLVRRIMSGQAGRPASAYVLTGAVAASGTMTPGTVVATNTCGVNGQTFTAIASNPGANQFLAGSAAVAGADLARAINEATATKNVVRAVAAANGVVTITSLVAGEVGNLVTLTSGTNLTRGAATLAGGAGTAVLFDS